MGPKKKVESSGSKKVSPSGKSTTAKHHHGDKDHKKSKDVPPPAGYLIACDVPTKQYIQHLNDLKPVDKKFILEDLDATHLLVKKKVREEIDRKVEGWMDEVRKVLSRILGWRRQGAGVFYQLVIKTAHSLRRLY
jgi:TFIIH basal transcription factor complex TTD-A subunit